MRRYNLFVATGVFLFAVGTAWAQKAASSTRQPTPALPSAAQSVVSGGFSAVSQLRVTPTTVQFLANNPGGSVPAGSVATLNWNLERGSNGRTWTLMVGASSWNFNGCTTVPISAVSLKCVSASVNGGGQSSAGCNINSLTPLPNTLPGMPVASGNEGNASLHSYTVTLSYQLTDSWRYIANTCPINVSYSVIAQ
jgi:hypothetical protein